MMNKRYLLALDQGTTSSRAVLFTLEGHPVSIAALEFQQLYPQPGWVEHNPDDILFTQIESMRAAVRQAGINPGEIAAIGITNQRETTLVWDRDTGRCVHNAIVWQCRRTAPYVDALKREGHADAIRAITGLVPDAYFSATKIKWILDTLQLHDKAARGDLCFGTVDSFLARHLVSGAPHVTDATNASRTMLFNLRTQDWDDSLLQLMGVPRAMLPEVVDSAQVIGMLRKDILGVEIPVAALAGDQHAALLGQACFAPGDVKNTYGTGCFMLMNTGSQPRESPGGLLTTMAWRVKGQPTYALEGSVFVAGAAIQWLRDELGLIGTAAESEALARSVPDTGGAYLTPAFTGLGAPHWNMYARGTLVGLTRGTSRAHIVRAALESIAYQSADLYQAMASDAGLSAPAMKVDGGASANDFLMQFQADIIDVPIVRPVVLETTALGAALLAGCGVGVYDSPEATGTAWQMGKRFEPAMPAEERSGLLAGWKRAVDTALFWADRRG